MDPADRNESFDEIKWNVLESELGVTETEKGPAPPEQPVGVKLPVEPAPAAEALDPAGATAARHELLNFFYYGHRESEDAGDMPEPALLYQHRDLSRVRHESPVCLTPTGPNAPGRTLAHVFDELIEATAGDDSDTSRRFRQHAMRLEFTIRSISSGVNAPGLLSDVCAKASEELLATPGLSKNRLEQLHDDVEKIRQALPFDGDVISCSAHAPERLFESAMAAFWHARSAKFLVLLDNVIREIYIATHGLNYILVVSPDAEELRVTDPKVYSRVFALAGDPVRVEVLKGAQIGVTFAAENVIAYWMDPCPAEILFISAIEKLLERWATKRLEPLIDSCGYRHNALSSRPTS